MNIAVCAICKNEKIYLDEWISFYKSTGFDGIYIYDNVSDDGTSELLQKYDENGVINRIFWPRLDSIPPQRSAYAHFLDNHACNYDFVLICDIDEFLLTPEYNTKKFLSEALDLNPNLGAIAVPWLIFGSSGEETYNPDNLVNRFQHCDNKISPVVKTIFRPCHTQNMRTHVCDLLNGDYLTGDLQIAEWHKKHPHWVTNNSEEGAVIYHYYTKSKEEFIKRRSLPKADRGGIISRDIEEYEQYSSQTRYNNFAFKLNTTIELKKSELRTVLNSSDFGNLLIDHIDIDNGWFFGVIKGKSTGKKVRVNLLINECHEISKTITINSSGTTPFSIKLKWASPKIKSFFYNINGESYKNVPPSTLSHKKPSILNRFIANFPSSEEHILSLFISTISVDSTKNTRDLILNLPFQKYPNHKEFCIKVCDYLVEGEIPAINDWLAKNQEYNGFLDRIVARIKNENI